MAQLRNTLHGEVTHLATLLSQQKEKRATVLIQRWQHHALVPAFAAWKSWLAERKRQKQLWRKTFLRMSQHQLWSSFRQWLHSVRKLRDSDHHARCQATQQKMEQLAQRLRETKRLAAGAVIANLQRTVVAKAFSVWRAEVRREREVKRATVEVQLATVQEGRVLEERERLMQRLQHIQQRATGAIIVSLQRPLVARVFLGWRAVMRAEKHVTQHATRHALDVAQWQNTVVRTKQQSAVVVVRQRMWAAQTAAFAVWRVHAQLLKERRIEAVRAEENRHLVAEVRVYVREEREQGREREEN